MKKLASILGLAALVLTLGLGTASAQQQAPDQTTAWHCCGWGHGGNGHGGHGGHGGWGCGW